MPCRRLRDPTSAVSHRHPVDREAQVPSGPAVVALPPEIGVPNDPAWHPHDQGEYVGRSTSPTRTTPRSPRAPGGGPIGSAAHGPSGHLTGTHVRPHALSYRPMNCGRQGLRQHRDLAAAPGPQNAAPASECHGRWSGRAHRQDPAVPRKGTLGPCCPAPPRMPWRTAHPRCAGCAAALRTPTGCTAQPTAAPASSSSTSWVAPPTARSAATPAGSTSHRGPGAREPVRGCGRPLCAVGPLDSRGAGASLHPRLLLPEPHWRGHRCGVLPAQPRSVAPPGHPHSATVSVRPMKPRWDPTRPPLRPRR